MKTDFLIIAMLYFLLIIFDTYIGTNLTYKCMENNNSGNDDKAGLGGFLLGVAAIIGGAFVTSFLIDKFSEKQVKYSCPNCSSDIDYKQEECHVCHTKLKWDF